MTPSSPYSFCGAVKACGAECVVGYRDSPDVTVLGVIEGPVWEMITKSAQPVADALAEVLDGLEYTPGGPWLEEYKVSSLLCVGNTTLAPAFETSWEGATPWRALHATARRLPLSAGSFSRERTQQWRGQDWNPLRAYHSLRRP